MYKIFVDEKLICISNQRAYEAFCREFREVNAAGGLVMASAGTLTGASTGSQEEARYLFIQRNGLWDLPKGHQEPGEDIRATALREVSEETGIPLERLRIADNACARACTPEEGDEVREVRPFGAIPPTLTPQKSEIFGDPVSWAPPAHGVAGDTPLSPHHPSPSEPGLICITDHCYKRDGIWHLKHTWWYAMELTSIGQNGTSAGNLLDASPNASDASPDSLALTPQTEEGITTATWVSPQDIPALLTHAYSSIPEVFRDIVSSPEISLPILNNN